MTQRGEPSKTEARPRPKFSPAEIAIAEALVRNPHTAALIDAARRMRDAQENEKRRPLPSSRERARHCEGAFDAIFRIYAAASDVELIRGVDAPLQDRAADVGGILCADASRSLRSRQGSSRS